MGKVQYGSQCKEACESQDPNCLRRGMSENDGRGDSRMSRYGKGTIWFPIKSGKQKFTFQIPRSDPMKQSAYS